MSLVLNYCWKEWRAQRGLLISYTLLIFACLCLGLHLAPRHYWFEDDFGAHALTWFSAAGVIGVVVFAAPGLVRGEFAGKEDQFVRRLPGALRPAFGGKLLFLILVTLALPLLGLLAGELFVSSLGHNWNSMFQWQWDGRVESNVPRVMVACMFALLLMPWVWAAAMWTPGGRLALLATVLLVLLVSIGVAAVVRQSPGIEPADVERGEVRTGSEPEFERCWVEVAVEQFKLLQAGEFARWAIGDQVTVFEVEVLRHGLRIAERCEVVVDNF